MQIIYTASCSQNLNSYLKSATFLRNNAGKNDVVFFENIGMLLQEVLLCLSRQSDKADKWQADQGFVSELLPCFFFSFDLALPRILRMRIAWEAIQSVDMSDMNWIAQTLQLVVAEDLWFHHMSLRLGRWNSNGGSIVRGDRSHERFRGVHEREGNMGNHESLTFYWVFNSMSIQCQSLWWNWMPLFVGQR